MADTKEFKDENGKWIPFDGMSENKPLEHAKEFFGKAFTYIGSSIHLRFNGVEQNNKLQTVMHFFRYT